MFPCGAKDNNADHAPGFLHRMRISSILNGPELTTYTRHSDFGTDADSDIDDMQTEDDVDCGSELGSTSTNSTRNMRRTSRGPRPACRKYTTEQAYFIWYYRTDLEQCWDEVERAFHHHFGDKRPKGGLQCKFYRMLEEKNVEKVRQQARSGRRRRGHMVRRCGVVQRTTARYSWM